jgi:hypothetical protein
MAKRRRDIRQMALAAGALVVVGMALPGAAAAAQLLSNNSFEAPNIGTGAYTYPGLPYGNVAPIAANQGGWTFSGAALVNGSGGNAWYSGAAPSGMDGVQFAALQNNSTLSQTFTANAGTLHLGWLDAGRGIGGMGDQSYNVLLDGAIQGSFSTASNEGFGFNSLNLSGLTAGNQYNLSFQGLTTVGDQTAFIDNVLLSDQALAAPPSSPSKIVTLGDMPLPGGFELIDDFDGFLAPGVAFTGGFVRLGSQGLAEGVSAPPPGTVSGYDTVMGGHSATLTSSRLLSGFSFYMGSPDPYNSIRFQGPGYDFTLNGQQIWQPEAGGGGDQTWGRRVTYDFGGYGVNQIVFSSGSNSFEFDNLAGRFQAGVPEPATWTMMILGFMTTGAMLRSRRRVLARA